MRWNGMGCDAIGCDGKRLGVTWDEMGWDERE